VELALRKEKNATLVTASVSARRDARAAPSQAMRRISVYFLAERAGFKQGLLRAPLVFKAHPLHSTGMIRNCSTSLSPDTAREYRQPLSLNSA
jgi:hypothetical protein